MLFSLRFVQEALSTVGYDDRTITGRLIAVLVILVSVGLFEGITDFLANRFLPSDEAETEMMALKTIIQESL